MSALVQDKIERQLQEAMRLHQLGQLPAARKIFEKLSRKTKRDPRPHFFLGTLLLQIGEADKAVGQLSAAARLAPDNPDIHFNLGYAHAAVGEIFNARDSYREAVELKPDFLDACNNLAGILQQLGQAREAAVYFRKATDLAPDNVDILANLALTLEMVNEFDAAQDVATTALALDPDLEPVRLLMAQLSFRKGEIDAAKIQLETFVATAPSEQYLSEAFLTLANIEERLENFEAAFKAMQSGNKAGAKFFAASGIDGVRFREYIKTMREFFRPDDLSATPRTAETTNPIFFVGFPRSGTTLVEQIMDAHPNVHTTAERTPLEAVRRQIVDRYGDFFSGLAAAEPRDLMLWRKTFWKAAEQGFGGSLAKTVLVDKMPFNLVELGFIHMLFPNAPVIVALRDPRDVCLSCFAQTFVRNDGMANFQDLRTTAETYALTFDLWYYFRANLSNPWIEYTYEDLVADPIKVGRDIFEFVGIEWQDDYLEDRLNPGARYVATPSRDAVTGKINKRAVARWRNYENQLSPILDILKPYLDQTPRSSP